MANFVNNFHKLSLLFFQSILSNPTVFFIYLAITFYRVINGISVVLSFDKDATSHKFFYIKTKKIKGKLTKAKKLI